MGFYIKAGNDLCGITAQHFSAVQMRLFRLTNCGHGFEAYTSRKVSIRTMEYHHQSTLASVWQKAQYTEVWINLV
jgi:hypothetical protein